MRFGSALLLCLLLAAPLGAREKLRLEPAKLSLPGAPAALVPVDLDGDGRRDLAVVVAYREWHQKGVTERTTMDAIEGLVEVMTIIPALVDRRELWVYRGLGAGRYEPAGAPLELDPSVLSLEAGPPGAPLVALTDEGLSTVRLGPGGRPELSPLIERRPVLARSRTFVRDLGLMRDLDGDGDSDLLFPAPEGPHVYLWQGSAFEAAGNPLRAPTWDEPPSSSLVRYYPLPETRDLDGDGRPELLFPHRYRRWNDPRLFPNLGDGSFAPGVDPLPDRESEEEEEDEKDERSWPKLVHVGDLDGDGQAEFVTQESLHDPDAGVRKEIREAKQPPFRYRVYRRSRGLHPEPDPYVTFEVRGYSFDLSGDDESDLRLPAGFQDLDGDGRLDLVTLTLDFSIFQAVRAVAAKSISIGLDFHVWCQTSEGDFRPVTGLDLSGKFRLDLDDLALGRLAQFEGDFDGDGRADFLQMGRGKKVTLHRGQAGCRYGGDPDLVFVLEDEPRDLRQVRILDLDGDELSDLLLVQPERKYEPGLTPPVRLDLYLSGATR